MTQTEINQAIKNALDNLNNLNQQVCDYWLSELHDENDEVIEEGNANQKKEAQVLMRQIV